MEPIFAKMIAEARTLLLGLVGGLIFLAGLAYAYRGAGGWGTADAKFLAMVLAGLALMEVPAYFGLRSIMMKRLRTETATLAGEARDRQLATGYLALTLIPAALLEGLALLGVVLAFATGDVLFFAPLLIVLPFMLALWPTGDRVRMFIQKITGQWRGEAVL